LAGVSQGQTETRSVSELFERVNPAVVEIYTRATDVPHSPSGMQVSMSGIGSGVLISPDGKILTASHVVETASAINVRFLGGETMKATVLSSDPALDVAVLQLDHPPRNAFVASIGDSDEVSVGDQVFVVGAPLGISHTLTVGYISGRRKKDAMLGGGSAMEYFQTDAAINQGNSGGPLFNMRGEVIGIVSHILSHSGGSEGIGFAVTSVMARELLEKKAFWAGVDGYMLSGELAKVLNVPPPSVGLLVQRVAAGSPADLLGLKGGTTRATICGADLVLGGDIVLVAAGTPLAALNSLTLIRERITSLAPGEAMTLTVLRGGTTVNLSMPLPAPTVR
jgi:S1-C subfamily serine protease